MFRIKRRVFDNYFSISAVLFVVAMITSTSLDAQEARMMGAVRSVQEAGQEYEQYTVKCGTIEERKLVWRRLGDTLWCGKLVGTFCGEGRVETAHLVCSPEYFAAVKELDTNGAAQVAVPAKKSPRIIALENEQRAIESELLSIEERKLELRNKELELLRQEANM